MKTSLSDWDQQWTTPSSRFEYAVPLLALAVAGLLAWL